MALALGILCRLHGDDMCPLSSHAIPAGQPSHHACTVEETTGTTDAIPDLADTVLSSWTLEGWKNGTKVGVIADKLFPGNNVDIRRARFADGSRALTNGAGESMIDELRLVANTTAQGTGSQAGFYPVHRIIGQARAAARRAAEENTGTSAAEGGAADGSATSAGEDGADDGDQPGATRARRAADTPSDAAGANAPAAADSPELVADGIPRTVFSYRAVPGLTATLTEDYTNEVRELTVHNRKHTLDDTPASRFTTTLATDPTASPLLLSYSPFGAPVGFTKTITMDVNGVLPTPAAEDFSLIFTPVPAGEGSDSGASTNPIRVTSGSADAALPPGTYAVAEAGRTDAQTALWKPRESGIVCTRGDKNTNILGPGNTLTISEDDMSAIACTVDNTAAVVVVTAYNESTKTQLTTGGAVTMDLIPTTDTSAYTSPGWADQPSTNSTGFLTANVDYRLSVPDGQSPGLVLVGVDEFTGTAYEDTDDVHSSEGNGTPLTESAFSIAGNTRKIIRGVFKNVDDVQKVSFAKAVKQPKTVAELGETGEGNYRCTAGASEQPEENRR